MKVVKVFNNNVVAVKMSDETEAIVTGNGVGFKKKPNDEINLGRVQNVYMIEKGKRNKMYRLMENTSYEYIEIAEEILERVKAELYPEIGDLGLFGLIDHISFAIERVKKNIELPNLILKETRWLYAKEYAVAKWALDFIYQKTGIHLPEDEAGYIVLNILNASGVSNKEDAVEIVSVTKAIIQILEEEFEVEINGDDFEYYRLVMHVKCLLSRIINKKETNMDNVEDLYKILLRGNRKIKHCISRIDAVIAEHYGVHMNQSEKLYLSIHICRLIK